jgi:predicted acyl esterase
VFFPGERVRLEIASSAFPLFDRNSSTDVPASQASHWSWRRSTQQILHTAEFKSVLHLPVIRERA